MSARKRSAATPAASAADEQFMRRALELAERYRGRTSPNPIVGCVIVDADGKVLAEGAHQAPGTKHAEADALAKLAGGGGKRGKGGEAAGATLYVNLEPCMHQGRTPPCAPAVIASGVTRVVIGSEDPIAGHGGGIEALRKAGIEVSRALVDECDAANRPFITWATQKRPAFTLKAAMTLDGKIATVKGESKWITGEAARTHVHHLRDTHDAVLVGVGTVLADDPMLTARVPDGRDPIRIVLDSQLRTPPKAKLLPGKKGPRTLIITSDTAPKANEKALVKAGAEVMRFESRASGQVPLDLVGRALGEAGITSVLVEGGGHVHASFLEAGYADELILFIAPKAVGGPAPSWVGGKGIASLASAYSFRFVGTPSLVGSDLVVRAVLDGSRAQR